RLRDRRALSRRGPTLREGDRDDGRRRRRRPYRLAVDHLLLPADAEAERQRPPLPRRAAALPLEPRGQEFLRTRRQAQGWVAEEGSRRQRQRRNRPLQG